MLFWVKEFNLDIFTHAPQQIFPKVLIINPWTEGNNHSSTRQHFFENLLLVVKIADENYGVR